MAQEMSADQVTPDMVIEQMPQHLDSAKAATTNATVQFDLSGDKGGKWWIKIHDGTAAFMQGKLKIKGDMGLAIKFQTLFKRPA